MMESSATRHSASSRKRSSSWFLSTPVCEPSTRTCDQLGASVAGLKKTYGSERFIDWVLVDRASLGRARRRCVHGGRRDVAEADVAVLRATVHTRRGELADYSRTSSGAHAGANWHGWGSDHFPVSADLELVLRR